MDPSSARPPSISTPEDPTQLPIVEVVHQTQATPEITSQGEPLDDPVVLAYARDHGPNVGHKARAVYREIARYVSRDKGYCFPSQNTIGWALELNRRQVAAQVKLLQAAGMLRAEPKDGASGRQTEYYFDHGMANGWQAVQRPVMNEETLIEHYLAQIAQLQQKLSEIDVGLVGAPMPEATEDRPQTARRENYLETDLELSVSPPPPPSETKANVTSGVTLALQHDIHGPFDLENIPDEYCPECVDEALESYAAIQKWNHSGGAHDTYRKDWRRFISDVKTWHLRKVEAAGSKESDPYRFRRDYQRYRGRSP